MEYENHSIPTRLDDKPKFLFFDYDVACIAIFPCGIGTMVGNFTALVGLFIGLILAMGYKSFKAGKHAGIMTHLLFWKTGTPTPLSLPPSHKRNFVG